MKFTKILILLLIVVFLSLACAGTSLASIEQPPTATQDAPKQISQPVSTSTTPPHTITVLGEDTTWNIREGAGLDWPVIGIANGGESYILLDHVNGWVLTNAGWICGRAFGQSEEC